jgi:hypothetical protein
MLELSDSFTSDLNSAYRHVFFFFFFYARIAALFSCVDLLLFISVVFSMLIAGTCSKRKG